MLGLLDDVRVLELTNALSGAFCTKLLADQGADAVKIEPPGRGDAARYEPPFLGGESHPDCSALFLAFNTNKRGITLDLETPSGRDLLHKLVADRDVLVESFTPGYLEGLGLGYDTLKRLNPRLIVTSITPFGQTGPYRHYRGTDLIAHCSPGGEPHPDCSALFLAFNTNKRGMGQSRSEIVPCRYPPARCDIGRDQCWDCWTMSVFSNSPTLYQGRFAPNYWPTKGPMR